MSTRAYLGAALRPTGAIQKRHKIGATISCHLARLIVRHRHSHTRIRRSKMLEKAAAMDKENQQQRHEEEVFRPSSSSRELCYLRSSSMDYRPRDVHEKSGLIHCPNIKMLVNDVAFLTERARDGDMVIYVGGTIGNYLPILGKMFPNLQFLVYDGNPTSMHYRSPQDEKASNIHLKPTWFSEKEARTLAAMRHPTPYDSSKTLLMVDSRNITKLALNQEDLLSSLPQSKSAGALRSIVTDENIEADLADQHAWVHALRPRAAMLKFRIPFSATGSPLSYFAGRLYLQPFAQRSSTEVRLCVDAEANADGTYAYPLASYPAQMHDGCLFHHNTIVRRQHLASPCRIKVGSPLVQTVCLSVFFSRPAKASPLYISLFFSQEKIFFLQRILPFSLGTPVGGRGRSYFGRNRSCSEMPYLSLPRPESAFSCISQTDWTL